MMSGRGIRVPRGIVAVAMVLATVVAGAGIVSAHGGFAVTTVGATDGAVDVPVSYDVIVDTGEPDAESVAEVDVAVTVSVDGDVVDRRSFTAEPSSSRSLSVVHAFDSAGTHTMVVNVTYSSGDWSESESTTTDVEVAPAGTAAALQICKDEAAADLSAPYELECHLEHDDGPLGGLLGGLVASGPIVAVALAVSIAVAGAVVVRRRRERQ